MGGGQGTWEMVWEEGGDGWRVGAGEGRGGCELGRGVGQDVGQALPVLGRGAPMGAGRLGP